MSHHTLRARRRKTLVATLIAAAAIGITACQDNESDASETPSSSASSQAASSDGGASDGGAGGSAGGGVRRCTSAAMSVRVGAADIGAGNIRYPLVFTNKGDRACTLSGFPGVSLLAKDGQAIGRPATREGGAGAPVTLAAGAGAHAVLHTVNDGVSDKPCWDNAALVRACPPGSKEAMTARVSRLGVCGDEFSVTAVSPGAGE
ncbi:DUF4232 domain-containing protein [Streptomyces sp. NPDC005271]|uniref:DUF4232 domain-containing protein n=1 Tax=unclassified Streptomyces TaxID=2593676 RepID=UPI0033B27A7E